MAALLPKRPSPPPPDHWPAPDFAAIHRELIQHKHLTRRLVWEEYRATHPDGYGCSRFCDLYQRWRRKQEVVLRQEHRAGEKLFVDHAGQTIPVQYPASGEIRQAELFVAVLGASNYTFAEASWTQGLGDWIGSHLRAFEFSDGVTEIVVPDNLKSGVTKTCRYEPGVNRTYEEMAQHYGVAVVPAHPRKPRDNGKVDSSVGHAQKTPLKGLRFESLDESQASLDRWEQRWADTHIHGTTKRQVAAMFAEEKPSLQALPLEPFRYYQYGERTVHLDGCVEVEAAYYSAPPGWIGRRV